MERSKSKIVTVTNEDVDTVVEQIKMAHQDQSLIFRDVEKKIVSGELAPILSSLATSLYINLENPNLPYQMKMQSQYPKSFEHLRAD